MKEKTADMREKKIEVKRETTEIKEDTGREMRESQTRKIRMEHPKKERRKGAQGLIVRPLASS